MALHRTGILPEQDVHAILLDHDLAFEVRYGCSCGSKGRLGRGSLQFRDDPSLQSLAEDPKAFAEGISGSPGDFKCAIEGEQFKIGSGNIAQDSKHHCPWSTQLLVRLVLTSRWCLASTAACRL